MSDPLKLFEFLDTKGETVFVPIGEVGVIMSSENDPGATGRSRVYIKNRAWVESPENARDLADSYELAREESTPRLSGETLGILNNLGAVATAFDRVKGGPEADPAEAPGTRGERLLKAWQEYMMPPPA